MNKKYLELKGKIIGYIDFDKRMFITERSYVKHFFHKFDGYGMSEAVLDKLENYKIEDILIIIDNFRGIYTTVNKFLCNGIDYTDVGNDKQLILPLSEFTDAQELVEIDDKQSVLIVQDRNSLRATV